MEKFDINKAPLEIERKFLIIEFCKCYHCKRLASLYIRTAEQYSCSAVNVSDFNSSKRQRIIIS